jgi:bifunctional non-homologous end joining protein LigD
MHNEEVQLCAFDYSSWRSTETRCGICRYRCASPSLARLLTRCPDGVFVSDFEEGEIGPTCFANVRVWA